MIKGVICDLDGFLVETWKTEPLEGVQETLGELKRRGLPVAVATNQAGPIWRAATRNSKYPSALEVASRIRACSDNLAWGGTLAWYISLWDAGPVNLMGEEAAMMRLGRIWNALDVELVEGAGIHARISTRPSWRKPAHGMLLAACNHWGIQPSEAVYGGDLASDRQAAEAAGMPFVEKLSDMLALLEGEKP